MAKAKTYPKISRKTWWLLRERLKKAMPSAISTTYIISLTQMAEASARANVVGPLRELGLTDEANKPTPLAERWRHDDEYKSVCHEIRQNIYPHDLIEAFDNPDPAQRDSIKTWFMKNGQVGESAARMYTDTYMLLSEADTTMPNDNPSTPAAARTHRQQKTTTRKSQEHSSSTRLDSTSGTPPASNHQQADEHSSQHHRRMPAIHIDVQVHISPDTPAEQIDRIFESMAKHLGTYIK